MVAVRLHRWSADRLIEEMTHMAKAEINKINKVDQQQDTVVAQELHNAAIDAPSRPLAVADPKERVQVHTDAIPATCVGELPGPVGTAEIHGNTRGLPTRDGDLDPEGWYGGQGGITGDRTRDMVPVSEDMREAKEKRHEPLAGR
jgi:hypothetical protein